MPSRRAARNVATTLLFTAAGVALGVLWAVKRQSASPLVAAVEDARAPVRVLPPSNGSWLGAPEPTAIPHEASWRSSGADDYETISPEDLSSAFLARATESFSPEDDELGVDTELPGFQIATIDDLTDPDLDDDPLDFEIPEAKLA